MMTQSETKLPSLLPPNRSPSPDGGNRMGPSYKGHVHGQLNKKQVEKRIATLERTLKQQTQELERMKRRSKGRK